MNFEDDRNVIQYSGTLESLRQVMTQPAEINGYVVEAYYYLSFFNPRFLKKIMADKKNESICKISNAYQRRL